MPEDQIRDFQLDAQCGQQEFTRRSYQIVQYAHESAKALLEAFYVVKSQRPASRGAATDEEQDILRAMLVTASAGLDATLKQLFRDALPPLMEHDTAVKSRLETFVERTLKKTGLSGDESRPYKFVAKALTAKSPVEYLVESYVYDLTGSSLQSSDELFKACAALGIEASAVLLDRSRLDSVFQVRNDIVHEMDIDFTEARRNRHPRAISTMVDYSNYLLEIAERVVAEIYPKLLERPGEEEAS